MILITAVKYLGQMIQKLIVHLTFLLAHIKYTRKIINLQLHLTV